ncbi:MAG: AAA family ATPase, partial [Clostridiales bacterium]|nr:AAA family ATPase [Clostridiales bacterium]
VKHPAWAEEEKTLEETIQKIEKEIKGIEKEIGINGKEHQRVVVQAGWHDQEQVAENLLKGKISGLHQLKLAQKQPYFARLDFIPVKKKTQKYYIGRWGVVDTEKLEVVVVDWRSPAANLYYSGQIGDVQYQAPDGLMRGELILKRMVTIQDQKLKELVDTSIIGQENYLKQMLGQMTSNRLKEVVTTIQSEQNKIIRHCPNKALMVQGVAGSGKTTIALHRIAWLLYAYQKEMSPHQMMIIAPNPLFLDYISQVLPDLGVEEVRQVTFEQLGRLWLKGKLPSIQSTSKVEERMKVGEEKYQKTERTLRYKGSMEFYQEIEKFMVWWEKTSMIEKDLYFGNQKLFSKEEVREILTAQLNPFPWGERIQEFKKMYEKKLHHMADKMVAWLKRRSEEKLNALLQLPEGIEKQQRARILLQSREKRIKEVETEQEKQKQRFVSLWPKLDLPLLYEEFLQWLKEKTPPEQQEIHDALEDTRKQVEKKLFYVEDLPPLLALGRKIWSFPSMDIRHVVIDEAQDVSPFMLQVIKNVVGHHSFTLVGDVLQGIYGNQGIDSWDMFQQQNFSEQGDILYLETSYRSTVEIMEQAEALLVAGGLAEKGSIRSVTRHGSKVEWIEASKQRRKESIVEKTIKQWQREGLQNIAVISPTQKSSKHMYDSLREKLPMFLLDEKKEAYTGGVCMLSLSMVKGLEFDGVIVMDADEKQYPQSPFSGKLLYVAATRALHKLTFVYEGKPTP